MRTALLSLLMFVVALTLPLMYVGCSSDDSPTSPTVTQITANGTLTPVSRTQAQGTVFVADAAGNPVTGLTAQNMTAVLKWGTPKVTVQDSILGTIILQTLSQSGKNIAVSLTMDYSGSMFVGPQTNGKYQRIKDMETGVKSFVNLMGSNDRAEIIKFGSATDVDIVQGFTSNKTLLTQAVDSLSEDRGFTALYKSIVQGLLDAGAQSSTQYARAAVAFTDGVENDSYPITRDSIFGASHRLAIPVYTVGLLDSFYHSTPSGQISGPEQDLVEIADTTGGFYFYAPNAAQLAQIYQRISGQLTNAYAVTINWPGTTLPPAGTLVSVTITVRYQNLFSTFTRTYVMP